MKAQAFLLGYTSKEAKDDTEIISHDEGLEDLGLVDDNKAALDEPEDGQFDAAVDTEGSRVSAERRSSCKAHTTSRSIR